MIVYSGAKLASSIAVGRTSSVRTNRLCQASSLITRTFTRCSGCDAAEQVGDEEFLLVRQRGQEVGLEGGQVLGRHRLR